MSIQKLKVGDVYQARRGGKHFLCVRSDGNLTATLVTLESGWTFIAQSTEIRHSGLISWITTVGGHRFGELHSEQEQAVRFFPDGFPWEGKEENEEDEE